MTDDRAWDLAGQVLLFMDEQGLLVEEPPPDAYIMSRERLALMLQAVAGLEAQCVTSA